MLAVVFEQEQILTTHNLAVLTKALDLRSSLAADELARSCFERILRKLQVRYENAWRSQLHALKASAYAWRQMIFFLSLLKTLRELEAFMAWARSRFEEQPESFRMRFRPALEGLELAARGETPRDDQRVRVFLGWTSSRHWVLG